VPQLYSFVSNNIVLFILILECLVEVKEKFRKPYYHVSFCPYALPMVDSVTVTVLEGWQKL
jgi:hypothetical protein